MKLMEPWEVKKNGIDGYIIYDENMKVMGCYANAKVAREHHTQALRELLELRKSLRIAIADNDFNKVHQTLDRCYICR
jgi:hypothetical protein